MTLHQSILKALYPIIMWFGQLFGGKSAILHQASSTTPPPANFYELSATLIDGTFFNFAQLKGKKVVIVNTASNCGFTAQYEALQRLHTQYKDSLCILGFPSNNFKQQEKGSDSAIQTFCKRNYGVDFYLFSKTQVTKNPQQHPVFVWLSHANKNGWCNTAPTWNFCKYVIDQHGQLTHFFPSAIAPDSPQFLKAIQ